MEYEQNPPAHQPLFADSAAGRAWAAAVRFLPLLAALLLLSLAAYPALSRDLWTDEAYTLSYTFHPSLGALLDDVRKNEETPPVYFVSTWLWARLFGQSEEAIRSLSLICGLGAALAFAGLARRRLEPAAAATAAAVLACAPLLQRYLVEARGYTLTLLLTIACVLAYERLVRSPQSRAAQLTYGASAAALFLCSYFSVALLAAHWLYWLWMLRAPETRRARMLAWAAAQLIVALCVLIWLPTLRYQMMVAPAVTANWSSGPRDYYFLAFSTIMGAWGPGGWFFLWLLASGASFTLMLAAALRPGDGGLLLRALALPALFLMAMALVLQVVAVRYLIVILPGSALAVGAGFSALRGRRPWLAWLLLATMASGLLLVRQPWAASEERGWEPLSAQIAAQADPQGDMVLFHPPWDQRIFEYYYHGPALPMAGAHHYDDFYYSQGYKLRETWTLPEALPVIAGHRRVWVFYDQTHHQVPALKLPYRQLGHWQEGRLELFLYEVTPP